jgi:uracil-DNA glycosylase
LFAALDATPFNKVKVAMIGQDPYPNKIHATGIAFSIPSSVIDTDWPPTLINIFKEYCSDLHLPTPTSGDLTPWTEQGVLLWNSTPTCETGRPGSHRSWPEWPFLTEEMVKELSKKGIVFVLLGAAAKSFAQYIDQTKNDIIYTSHPSPLGSKRSSNPFLGSRVFSTINDKLLSRELVPIEWRLSGTPLQGVYK